VQYLLPVKVVDALDQYVAGRGGVTLYLLRLGQEVAPLIQLRDGLDDRFVGFVRYGRHQRFKLFILCGLPDVVYVEIDYLRDGVVDQPRMLVELPLCKVIRPVNTVAAAKLQRAVVRPASGIYVLALLAGQVTRSGLGVLEGHVSDSKSVHDAIT
jgi:hypothetical protein